LVVFDDADNEEKEESPDIMEFAPFIFNECPPEGSLLLIMVFIIGWRAIGVGVGFDVVGCSDRLNQDNKGIDSSNDQRWELV